MRLRRLNSWMAVTIASRFVFALVNLIAFCKIAIGNIYCGLHDSIVYSIFVFQVNAIRNPTTTPRLGPEAFQSTF